MPHRDPVVRAAYLRAWKLANPERVRWLGKVRDATFNANRRAALAGVEGVITTKDVHALFDHGVCFYCQSQPTGRYLTIDHRVPLAKGGENTPDNLVTACLSCNISKYNSDRPGRWARDFDACQHCGSTTRRHTAKGYCTRCHHLYRKGKL